MTLSIAALTLSAIGILQVGVVLGMWLKSMLGGNYDWGNSIEIQPLKLREPLEWRWWNQKPVAPTDADNETEVDA